MWKRTLPIALAALASGACSSSVCPYPDVSTLTIEPPAPKDCLDVTLTSCLKPTLRIKSSCDAALYMPVEYGVFSVDASSGPEVEIVKNDTLTYEVRADKATSTTAKRKDYVIPARLGPQRMTFRFFVTSGD